MRKIEQGLERLVFWSRWIQIPMYLGLIVAAVIYAYKFLVELVHLVTSANTLTEELVMLSVLTLVDIVMVANLVIMVVIGGYSIFVSKMDLDSHEDKPDWLDHIDAGVLKVKLAGSLASVSGIHLLKSFINASQQDTKTLAFQIAIHVVFLFSTLLLAYTEKVLWSSRH